MIGASKREDDIRANMRLAGTYNEAFEPVIKMLAKVQTELARAEKDWRDPELGNGEYVSEYTNKAGATNLVKNPYFAVVVDLRQEVLSFSAQLGLTPQGQRRVMGGNAKIKQKGPSKFETALAAAAKAAGKM